MLLGQECARQARLNDLLGFLGRGRITAQFLWPGMEARLRRSNGQLVAPSAEAIDEDGTYFDRAGLIRRAIANRLRFGRAGGTFEGARQNRVTRSTEINSGIWTKGQLSVTADSVAAPNGAIEAETLTDNAANTTHHLRHAGLGVPAGTRICWSCFVKDNDRRYVALLGGPGNGHVFWMVADLQTGTVTASGRSYSGVLRRTGIENYGNGWYRLWVVGEVTDYGTIYPYIYLRPNGTGNPWYDFGGSYVGDGSSLYAWGAQFEEGVFFPSSFIPTTSAAVTRSAENIRYDNTAEIILPAAAFTIGLKIRTEFSGVDLVADAYVLDATTATDGVRAFFDQSNGGKLTVEVLSGGATVATLVASAAPVRGIAYRIVITGQVDDFALYINGTLNASQGASAAAPTAMNATVYLGQDAAGGNHADCRLQRGVIVDHALSAGQAASLMRILRKAA